jgi:hypothetical protein
MQAEKLLLARFTKLAAGNNHSVVQLTRNWLAAQRLQGSVSQVQLFAQFQGECIDQLTLCCRPNTNRLSEVLTHAREALDSCCAAQGLHLVDGMYTNDITCAL